MVEKEQLQFLKENIFLKGTWGQNNGVCLKWSFIIIERNGIKQTFQKFTCKPQLAYSMFIHVYDVSFVETQFNHTKLRILLKNG